MLLQVYDLRTGTADGLYRVQTLKRQFKDGTMCGNTSHLDYLLEGVGEGPPPRVPGLGYNECPWKSSPAFQAKWWENAIETDSRFWKQLRIVPGAPGPLGGNHVLENPNAAGFRTFTGLVQEFNASIEGPSGGNREISGPKWTGKPGSGVPIDYSGTWHTDNSWQAAGSSPFPGD